MQGDGVKNRRGGKKSPKGNEPIRGSGRKCLRKVTENRSKRKGYVPEEENPE